MGVTPLNRCFPPVVLPLCPGAKIDILRSILRLFSHEPKIKDSFRGVNGFVYLISTILTLADARASSDLAEHPGDTQDAEGTEPSKLALLHVLIETLTGAIKDHLRNRHHLEVDVGWVTSFPGLSLTVSGE